MGRLTRLVALRRKVKDSYEGLRYNVPDHLGGTIRVVDTAGSTIDDIRYHAFGATRSGGAAMPTDKLFTGQTMDASTGLYFYGARYYDPVLGRFLAPDRAGPGLANPQSLNKYSYVLNNPVRYTDPTGNRPWDGEPEDDGGVGGDGGDDGGGDWGGDDMGGGDGGYSDVDDLGLGSIDSGMESPTDSPSLGYGSPTDDVSGSFFPGVDPGGVVGPDTMQLDFGTPDACYFSPLELYDGPKPSDVMQGGVGPASVFNSVMGPEVDNNLVFLATGAAVLFLAVSPEIAIPLTVIVVGLEIISQNEELHGSQGANWLRSWGL